LQLFRPWIPVFVLVCASLPLLAQNAAARESGAVRQVTLGNATVPLDGLWKFHIGDDMAWAQPDFDDSGWGTMDLTPPAGSYDPYIGSSGYLPGWTARGNRGYSGYAWYRLKINVQDGRSLVAIKMPDNFDDAYQVYVNGQLIGQFGQFTTRGITTYNALPRAFPLPANFSGGPVTIAIRMWMAAFTPLVDQDAGGLHGPPVLGQAATISALLQLDWDAVNRSLYGEFLEMAILLLALLAAFGLFWLDRSEPAYLWLGLTCAAVLARVASIVVGNYPTWVNANFLFLLQDAVLIPAAFGLWVLFWAYWFRLGGMAQVHRMVWSLVVLLDIGMAMLRAPLYGSVVPVHAVAWLSPLTLALKLMMGVLLVWVTIRGIRKNRTEGWLALPAVLLVALSLYEEELVVLHVPAQFYYFGIAVSLFQVSTVLSLAIITILMLRRFLLGQRDREQWRLEIEQARQVQQMLIPEALPQIPGLTIESEYRPAQRTGGDFFQILPDRSDGSVLIVVGDVTGHGLQAGMLVALIVGIIRNETAHTFDSLTMLNALNRTLCGRGQAYATCLALRITADGEVTLANAGHMPPYLNGKEYPMEGALPLGMVESAEFPVMHFQLAPGDTLMLLSDGVAEAQDGQGHLFGFERIETMLRQPITAAEVATAAQKFGQQDDISVMRVVRAAKATERTEAEPALAAG
jgi:Stage II sporulation protein E (SpoIIE)